jgi:hypothetical protein
MTTARPTVYLTNFASRSAPHRGPGRVWSIMAKPRRWEHGEGSVWRLTPRPTDLDAVRSGAMHIDEYRRRFKIDVLARPPEDLTPGHLDALVIASGVRILVGDGDTLCCTCSREAAARGECHRVWASELLAKAGWRVILDGVEVEAP